MPLSGADDHSNQLKSSQVLVGSKKSIVADIVVVVVL